MASVADKLNKLREERIAREKARIEKLRELNLKKYNSFPQSSSSSSTSIPGKPVTNCSNKNFNPIKNAGHVNGTIKRQVSTAKPMNYVKANKNAINLKTKAANVNSKVKNKVDTISDKKINKLDENKVIIRKNKPLQEIIIDKDVNKRETVFDRLYKPKTLPKQTVNNVMKLKTDPSYLNKIINNSKMITSKRHTTFETVPAPARRSISAVHFKRIRKSELPKCIHKWASIGEKIDKVHLEDVNEDEDCNKEKIVSAVKSERKKVKFQTPSNFNSPRPEELQSRLVSWLQKRGKSIESYHHLQCFGVHHLPKAVALNFDDTKFDSNEDNKENIALEHDSDNESFHENMNNQNGDVGGDNKVDFPVDKWRRASYFSDSIELNESRETTLTSCGTLHHLDELLHGALNDLTELLREGFEWEQCAHWLRAIREKFPAASDTAAYWECRAALEERRGDLPASLQCWEQAVASGTEQSVAEANLDNLLDKFMQLKISPKSGKPQMDPKLVDVKSVFKSTIIRFGVQQAKLCIKILYQAFMLCLRCLGCILKFIYSSVNQRTP